MQTFQELSLRPEILRALEEMGFTAPTPIQAETLPRLLGKKADMLGLAATGTGKTAAFSLPLLERLDTSKRGVQGLVLCPTRELAIQVAGQIDLLGKYLGVKALPIYGGVGYRDQFNGLDSGVSIVVGTPGRVCDHLDKGSLKLGNLQVLVLDEADEMISMGFQEDLERVLKAAPEGQANIWLFSATLAPEVRNVADSYLNNPEKVQINRTEVLSATVEQVFYYVHEYDKPDVLTKIIDSADDFFGIVFCQTKALVTDLGDYLASRGYKAATLHGDLTQDARDRVMNAFRERQVNVLIATDVACRGLDVKDVTHVVNYSLPRELDNYVHRIGRTARSGKAGTAISLVTKSHMGLVRRIEQVTKSRMTEGRIPSHKEIAAKKVARDLNVFQDQTLQARAAGLLNDEWKAALEGMEKDEIAARFLVMRHPEMFADRAERMRDSRAEQMQSSAPRGARRDYGDKPRFEKRERSFDKPRFEKRERLFDKPRFEKNFDKPRFEKKYEERSTGETAPKATAHPVIDIPELFDDGPAVNPVAKPAQKFERKPESGFKKFDKPKFDKPKLDKPRFDKPGFKKFDKPRFERRAESRADRPAWKPKAESAPSLSGDFKPQKRFGKLPPWQPKEENRPWMNKSKPGFKKFKSKREF